MCAKINELKSPNSAFGESCGMIGPRLVLCNAPCNARIDSQMATLDWQTSKIRGKFSHAAQISAIRKTLRANVVGFPSPQALGYLKENVVRG